MSEHSTTSSQVLVATTQIAASYLAKNETQADQIPALITRIHGTLLSLSDPAAQVASSAGVVDKQDYQNGLASFRAKPAIDPKKSVFPDYIVCLEDGKKLKMLKRHLRTSYGLTPEQYRKKWDLPEAYPLTAPNYAKVRSGLAKQHGLGLSGEQKRIRVSQ